MYPQALSNQQKAVLMSERVLGIEHPNTIQEYVSHRALEHQHLVVAVATVSSADVFFPDALGSVLLCQWPAVNCPETPLSRPLPLVAG